MNIQTIIIAILFAAAVFYVSRLLYKNIFTKKGCGSNCKCGLDFSAIDPAGAKKSKLATHLYQLKQFNGR